MEMKTFYTAIVVLSSLIVSPALALDDPSFEEWSDDESLVYWIKESSVNLTKAAEPVYDEEYAVGLENTGSANKGIYQDVLVEEGHFYVFCVYFFPVVNTDVHDMGIVVSWYDASGGYITYTGPAYSSGLDAWEQVCIFGACAPGGAATARLRVRCYADSLFSGYADLASFYEVECTDVDGDCYAIDGGVCGEVDCDDTDASINPGENEVCGNEVDEDCSGVLDDLDYDTDGFVSDDPACGGDDCDDSDYLINPDADDPCDWEEIDQNCDGMDGVPETEEAGNCYDGIDNDCDGIVDECYGGHNIAYKILGGKNSGIGGYLGLLLLPFLFLFALRNLARMRMMK